MQKLGDRAPALRTRSSFGRSFVLRKPVICVRDSFIRVSNLARHRISNTVTYKNSKGNHEIKLFPNKIATADELGKSLISLTRIGFQLKRNRNRLKTASRRIIHPNNGITKLAMRVYKGLGKNIANLITVNLQGTNTIRVYRLEKMVKIKTMGLSLSHKVPMTDILSRVTLGLFMPTHVKKKARPLKYIVLLLR
jgi:hypothetical protein